MHANPTRTGVGVHLDSGYFSFNSISPSDAEFILQSGNDWLKRLDLDFRVKVERFPSDIQFFDGNYDTSVIVENTL